MSVAMNPTRTIGFWATGVFLLCLSACGPRYSPEELDGNWSGIEFTEEGDSVLIDPTELKFYFSETGTYTYDGTLRYREEGEYRLERDLLVTKDALVDTAAEKAVRILTLNPDTLRLKMNAGGREQLLTLLRQ